MSSQPLISAGALAERLEEASLTVVDCRFDLSDPMAGRRDFELAHIPGAVFMDLNEDLASPVGQFTGRHPLPDVATLSATVGRLGIGNATSIVVYDSDNGAIASRAWWILRWLGHTNVRLLDGGLAAWTESGYPLSAEAASVVPVKFISNVQHKLVITTAEICEAAMRCSDLNILDARDATRFAGEAEPIDGDAGHIPGARNLPYSRSMKSNGCWKNIAQLTELWRQQLGDDRQVEWVAMCGSGVTACHLALSAVTAGYREPRLYVGSWSEWITDSCRPIAAGCG